MSIPYGLLCTALGIALGWWPAFLHGPIAEKFNVLYLRGSLMVWAWYVARSAVGFLVGITHWPERWWLRGPLCGVIMIFPLGIISLSTPGCGPPCMFWNHVTAITIGTSVAGIAYLLTGKHHD